MAKKRRAQPRVEMSMEQHLAALGDPDPCVRASAARALGEHVPRENPALLEALIRALADPDGQVREAAASALRDSAPPAIPGLMALLTDEGAGARIEAAVALGSLQAHEAIDALVERLHHDPDPQVRGHMASALGDMKDERVVAPLAKALGRVDAPAAERFDILYALGETRSTLALPALCAALGDPDPVLCSRAARSLFWLVDPDDPRSAAALEPLCAALESAAPSTAESLCDTLGKLGDPRAVPVLVRAMRRPGLDDDEDTSAVVDFRCAAVKAITRIDAQGQAALFLDLLQGDPCLAVRAMAARALAQTGKLQVSPQVRTLMTDPAGDAGVKVALSEALARGADPAALPLLLDALRDEDAEVRRGAASALCEAPDPRALPALLALLDDDEQTVRAEGALALAALTDERAIPPLQAQLAREPHPYVRRRVAWALSFFAPPKARPLLIGCLRDEDPHVRATAADALVDLCKDAATLRQLVDGLPAGLEDDVLAQLREALHLMESGDEEFAEYRTWPRRLHMGTVHYE